MDTYTLPVELTDKSTVTVRAWTLEEIGANASDFEKLIDALNAPVTGQASPFPVGVAPQVLRRLLLRSLVVPEDADRLRAPDIPEVLEAIYTVNGLRELTKKALGLRLQRQEAQREALERLTPPRPLHPSA